MISRELGGKVVANVRRFITTLGTQLRLVPRFNEGMRGGSKKKLRDQMAVVDEVARIVTSTLDFDKACDEFATEVKKLVDFDRIALHVIDRDAGTSVLKYVSGVGPPGAYVGQTRPLIDIGSRDLIESARTEVENDPTVVSTFPFGRKYLELGLNSMIIVALVSNRRTVGILTLRSRCVGAYTARDQTILERLASQIAPAVRNAQLYEQTREAEEEIRKLSEELSVVDEVARIVTSTLDIQQVYEEFAQQLGELVDFDRVAIAVIDQDAGTFEYKYSYGQTLPGYNEGQIVPLEGTRTQKVLMTGQTLVAEDIASQPQFRADPRFSNLGMRASITTPLVYRGKVFGTLQLGSKKVAAFGPREQAIIERLASQIAPAVRNAQLYEQSKQVESELRQSEARANALLESAPQGIIATSSAGEIVQVNDAALEVFGYSREELLGQPVDMLVPQEVQPGHAAHRDSYFSAPEVRPMGMGRDLHGLRKDGSIVPLEIGLSSIPTQSGPIALAFISDITERKAAEEAERRWTEETSIMAEIGRVISSSLDISEVYDRLGEEIKRLIPFDRFGMSLVNNESGTSSPTWVLGTDVPGRREGDELPLAGAFAGEVVRTKSAILLEAETEPDIEHRFPLLLANFRAGFRSFLAAPLFSRDTVIGVLQVHSKNRGIYTQRHVELLERIGNQIAGAIANSQLYAEQRDSEKRIKASLGEKEVLLKEINHRVKNNLQIISSLLNLQFRDVQDAPVLDMLKQSQGRIQAMAMIHEKLYQSEDLARIDFGEYLQSLTSDLRVSYGVSARQVELKVEAEQILLGVDIAIPCGLIVNELVSNALKHAFPTGGDGEINVAVVSRERQLMLKVSDNGVGFPEGFDFTLSDSLGLKLVNAWVGQLGGTIELRQNGGAEIAITFSAV